MSVPKCGPLKSKWLLELVNDVTFLGAQAFMTGSGGVQGSDCKGGWLVAGQGLYRKMEQKISWTGSPLRRASD